MVEKSSTHPVQNQIVQRIVAPQTSQSYNPNAQIAAQAAQAAARAQAKQNNAAMQNTKTVSTNSFSSGGATPSQEKFKVTNAQTGQVQYLTYKEQFPTSPYGSFEEAAAAGKASSFSTTNKGALGAGLQAQNQRNYERAIQQVNTQNAPVQQNQGVQLTRAQQLGFGEKGLYAEKQPFAGTGVLLVNQQQGQVGKQTIGQRIAQTRFPQQGAPESQQIREVNEFNEIGKENSIEIGKQATRFPFGQVNPFTGAPLKEQPKAFQPFTAVVFGVPALLESGGKKEFATLGFYTGIPVTSKDITTTPRSGFLGKIDTTLISTQPKKTLTATTFGKAGGFATSLAFISKAGDVGKLPFELKNLGKFVKYSDIAPKEVAAGEIKYASLNAKGEIVSAGKGAVARPALVQAEFLKNEFKLPSRLFDTSKKGISSDAIQVYHTSQAKIAGTVIGRGQSETAGLYVASFPVPDYLRAGMSESGLGFKFSLFPSNPTISAGFVKDVERIPQNIIRQGRNLNSAVGTIEGGFQPAKTVLAKVFMEQVKTPKGIAFKENMFTKFVQAKLPQVFGEVKSPPRELFNTYLSGRAGEGKAFITPVLEGGFKTGFKGEIEAVIPQGSRIAKFGTVGFTKYKGQTIPIDVFKTVSFKEATRLERKGLAEILPKGAKIPSTSFSSRPERQIALFPSASKTIVSASAASQKSLARFSSPSFSNSFSKAVSSIVSRTSSTPRASPSISNLSKSFSDSSVSKSLTSSSGISRSSSIASFASPSISNVSRSINSSNLRSFSSGSGSGQYYAFESNPRSNYPKRPSGSPSKEKRVLPKLTFKQGRRTRTEDFLVVKSSELRKFLFSEKDVTIKSAGIKKGYREHFIQSGGFFTSFPTQQEFAKKLSLPKLSYRQRYLQKRGRR